MSHTIPRRCHRATTSQREWEKSNLAFIWVEPVRVRPCRLCQTSDPLDADEDFMQRWGIMRRRYPHALPDQLKAIVWAGIRAEQQVVAAKGVRACG